MQPKPNTPMQPDLYDMESGYLRSCGWHEDENGGWSHKKLAKQSVDLSYAVAVQIMKHVKGAA
jgi:hypothetical protein